MFDDHVPRTPTTHERTPRTPVHHKNTDEKAQEVLEKMYRLALGDAPNQSDQIAAAKVFLEHVRGRK